MPSQENGLIWWPQSSSIIAGCWMQWWNSLSWGDRGWPWVSRTQKRDYLFYTISRSRDNSSAKPSWSTHLTPCALTIHVPRNWDQKHWSVKTELKEKQRKFCLLFWGDQSKAGGTRDAAFLKRWEVMEEHRVCSAVFRDPIQSPWADLWPTSLSRVFC